MSRYLQPMLRGVVCVVVLAFHLAANATPVAPANQTAQAIQINIELLQFVTQTKLSAAERDQVASEVTSGMSQVPQNVIRRDGLIVTTLANATRSPKDAPRLRELWRYDIAAHVPHNDIEYILTERYDAAIVLDEGHQRIVTRQTLLALRSCTAWLAQNIHKSPPDANFVPTELAYIKSSWGRLTDDVQDAFAHVARNCPRAIDFFNGIVSAQRTQFFSGNAKSVTSTTVAATDAALVSRIAYNIVVRRAGGAMATEGRVFDYMVQQSLLQQQLQRSVFRNPSLSPPN